MLVNMWREGPIELGLFLAIACQRLQKEEDSGVALDVVKKKNCSFSGVGFPPTFIPYMSGIPQSAFHPYRTCDY